MTRDDVIRLAKEAGVINPSPYTAPWEHEQLALERFYHLAIADFLSRTGQYVTNDASREAAIREATARPVGQSRAEEPLFYVQDSRSYVGNDVLWWAANGGYTSDLSKAQTYTLGQAQAMHDSRHSDIPWPKAYVDAKTRPAVDMQYIRRDEALRGSGITLAEPKRERKESIHCLHCGSFLTQNQVFFGCPKCGASNAP